VQEIAQESWEKKKISSQIVMTIPPTYNIIIIIIIIP
jgi:hypothetical protein